jgi:transcriptional regulator with XRE-family HTH domain
MEVARQFGVNLRRLREAAGVSQEELGLRSELHRTEIGLLERGARVPRIDTLIKIATGLGVRIDCELLGGIRWTPSTTESGTFTIESRKERDRAAALRDGRMEADAVQLVHAARDELAERMER